MENGIHSPAIQAIDRKSVHQICSGQVVLDLATAVKELVENGLDAGADNIEIKLKEFGKEVIEVSDNGCGIEQKDFEALALKHYTSKLKEFNDLIFVDTFGFRGEALSSLSALSNICITTKHQDATVGTKLEFDHDGRLSKQTAVARAIGTTVAVTNIFFTLPVRYKEFQRNYKKEFIKMMHVLYSYSLIKCDVRFICYNTVAKKRQTLLTTNGKNNIIDIISSIFGPVQAQNIIPIQQNEAHASELEEFDIPSAAFDDFKNQFVISGYISEVRHGCGRSSPDRQFLFINKRPCDFSKLSRIINEVYHMFNHHQYPFVMLDVSLKREFVDVNVTPNKRMILIHQEKVLFALLKSALKSMFENSATFYNMQSPSVQDTIFKSVKSPVPEYENYPMVTEETRSALLSTDTASPLERFRCRFDKSSKSDLKATPEQQTMTKFFTFTEKKRKLDVSNQDGTPLKRTFISPPSPDPDSSNLNTSFIPTTSESLNNLNIVTKEEIVSETRTGDVLTTALPGTETDMACQTSSKQSDDGNNNKELVTVYDHNSSNMLRKREVVTVNFDLDKLRKKMCKYIQRKQCSSDKVQEISCFRAKISPNENRAAENELSKQVSKDMFSKMEIIGQFNLGFIITKLEEDLFIVDQHATDEKYNFEILQQKHCLKGQMLIQPLEMELTFVNKGVLMENIEIFQKNGFDFNIAENDQNDQLVKLMKVPASRNWIFGPSDIEELIFMLTESPGVMCRPSNIRRMFASRACRTSVMVGTALNVSSMKNLINHMSEIDHPWNCPHGRPTMRHLVNLQRIST